MKISELQHRDPAWAYIELNDGSLVAMPKKAVEELQEENKQLKEALEKARSYKHVIKMYKWRWVECKCRENAEEYK